MWMSVHHEKVNIIDKQGFIERVFDCFGRDLRRSCFQVMLANLAR